MATKTVMVDLADIRTAVSALEQDAAAGKLSAEEARTRIKATAGTSPSRRRRPCRPNSRPATSRRAEHPRRSAWVAYL